MTEGPAHERTVATVDRWANLRSALADLFDQEFSFSTGHLAAVLNGCLFAPSLLGFWFVNGVVDFSAAVAVGAVGTPAGLQVRLLAYVLLVPAFLLARVGVHVLYPAHRAQVLSGSCPKTRLMSLDWCSVGILTTGLPLALQTLGPWVMMNAIFLVGVFGLPRAVSERRARRVRLLAVVTGVATFAYARYGTAVSPLPPPAATLGPAATLRLGDATTGWLVRLVNSVLFGPVVVGAFAVVTNRVLTRPELADLPLVRHALPRRDADVVVVTNAAVGTGFYLAVVAAATGWVVVVP